MLNSRQSALLIHSRVAMPMFRAIPFDVAPFHKVHRLVILLHVDQYISHPDFLPGVYAGIRHFCLTVAPGQELYPVDVVNVVHAHLSEQDQGGPRSFQIGFAFGWVLTMMAVGKTPIFPPPSDKPLKRVRRRRASQ